MLKKLYGHSLALLTDLYQITMAYGYWKSGMANREAVFHLFFRKTPFTGGYVVAAGLEPVVEFLRNFHYTQDDLDYLATLTGTDDGPLFEEEFLEYLRNMRLELDIDAMPEGTIAFPFEPLLRTRGPIIACQLMETPLLNLINFSSLIATKAARVKEAAGEDPVLEFGLRRAQGIDGGVTAARASYVGGADATSNLLAGKLCGIPVKGTHAHSWVMAFESEEESFEAWARAMPNNSVFLVDTYDTLEGVRKAVRAAKWLRENGRQFAGVRLDSGDLAYLSVEARRILDAAGLPDARIYASGDLDEHIIESLKKQGAKICVWGVGTKLATAKDDPALNGVYKLSAVRKPDAKWDYRLKLSEQSVKVSNPGVQQVRRFTRNGEAIGDAIFDELATPPEAWTIVNPLDPTSRKRIPRDAGHEDLLVPIMRGGNIVYTLPSIQDIRKRTAAQLALFHPGIRRFLNPHLYPAGLEKKYYRMKERLVMETRGHEVNSD